MGRNVKIVVFWAVMFLAAILLWQTVRAGAPARASAPVLKNPEISYSQFLKQLEAGSIAKVTIARAEVDGTYRDGRVFHVIIAPYHNDLVGMLSQKDVEIWFRNTERDGPGNFASWILNFGPVLLIAALWFFMIRQMNRSVPTSSA